MRVLNAQRGVTLVELLVALSILGFTAALVVLNAPPPRPPAKALALEMAARVLSARDAALMSGAAHRLEVIEGDYRITRYTGDDVWRPVTPWRTPRREGVSLTIRIDDPTGDNALALNGGESRFSDFTLDEEARVEANTDYVALDPFGPSAQFSARFSDRRTLWRVDHDPMGVVTVKRQ